MFGAPDLVPPPVAIAAYRAEREAVADMAIERSPVIAQRDQLERAVGALFGRMLRTPSTEDPERAYFEAIKLSNDEKYRRARRALYDWEDNRAANGWPTEPSLRELQDLVIEHDLLVEKACRATVKRRVFRVAKLVVEVGAEFGAEALRLPGLGAGASLVLELVQARFPSLEPETIDPLLSPGAALSTAIGVMYHG